MQANFQLRRLWHKNNHWRPINAGHTYLVSVSTAISTKSRERTTFKRAKQTSPVSFYYVPALIVEFVLILKPDVQIFTSQTPVQTLIVTAFAGLSFWLQTKPPHWRSIPRSLMPSCKSTPFDRIKKKKMEKWSPKLLWSDPGNVVEMNTLQSTLNKPSQWTGYHGEGTWLNIVAYFD